MKKAIPVFLSVALLISYGFLIQYIKKSVLRINTISLNEFLYIKDKNKYEKLKIDSFGNITYKNKAITNNSTHKPLKEKNTNSTSKRKIYLRAKGIKPTTNCDETDTKNYGTIGCYIGKSEYKKRKDKTITINEFLYDPNPTHWKEVYLNKYGQVSYRGRVIAADNDKKPLNRKNACNIVELNLYLKASRIKPDEEGCSLVDIAQKGLFWCYSKDPFDILSTINDSETICAFPQSSI